MTKGTDETADSPALDETQSAPARPSAPPALEAGARLGNYQLRKRLGAGAMGVVWSAYDPELDRLVAIKLLLRDDAADQLRTRLLREARAMARLKHPNVLTVHEVGSSGARDYIVMELVDGSNLDQFIASHPPHEYLWDALLAAGRGLAAAHAAGLVHRDFKPHNVLRSRDGRVLVTDFGLARGIASREVPASAPSWPPTAEAKVATALGDTLEASGVPQTKDSADLASPLTQTGALIGTPAYMAPEVYMGSQPDPRTDQFAYCVTVWQALAGERPFKGATLDELRRAALAGVDGVKAELPRSVRPILERGLSPDPQKRWPDMDALLDALERTVRKPPGKRWPLVAGGIAAATIVAAVAWPRSHAEVVPSCAPTETMLADAWSPAIRAELTKRAPAQLAGVGAMLDDVRGKWVAAYDRTCKDIRSTSSAPRLACLADARDQLAAVSRMLRAAEPAAIATRDLHPLLPQIGVCEIANPLAPPAPPADRRDAVLAVMAKTLALVGEPGDAIAAALPGLRADARAAGWAPLEARVAVQLASELIRRGDAATARAILREMLPRFAAARDPRYEAIARLAELAAVSIELEDPGEGGAVDPKGKYKLPPEIDRALTYARTAVHAAGDDPIVLGDLEMVLAAIWTDAGQWNLYKRFYDDAATHAQQAQKLVASAGDMQAAALAALGEAAIYLRRGDAAALDDAGFVLRTMDEQLVRARLTVPEDIARERAWIAFARNDWSGGDRDLDRLSRPAPPTGTIKGRVTTAAGEPARGASIVSWHGELHTNSRGEPIAPFPSYATATVRDDGTFEVAGDPGGALRVIWNDDTAVTPTTAAPLDVRLTRRVRYRGRVTGRLLFGAVAAAVFPVGPGASLSVEAPCVDGMELELDHLPSAPAELSATARSGTGHRLQRFTGDLAWTIGVPIEVIARGGKLSPGATAWIIRGGLQALPRTRGELESILATTPNFQWSPLVPIGSDATDAGRGLYHRGDRHAVLLGTGGKVTICIASDATAATPITCRTQTVMHAGRNILNYNDDRIGADVNPVVIEP